MAERVFAPDTPELRAKSSGFAWSSANAKAAAAATAMLSAIYVVFGECDW